tara:strand:- start:378 stop:755 length:378 start_codon:yes stop_codon:yes gene_type:complete
MSTRIYVVVRDHFHPDGLDDFLKDHYGTTIASNSTGALMSLSSRQNSVLIYDLFGAGSFDPEFSNIFRICKREEHPVIITSEYPREDIEAEGISCPEDYFDFLQKPYEFDHLCRIIGRVEDSLSS